MDVFIIVITIIIIIIIIIKLLIKFYIIMKRSYKTNYHNHTINTKIILLRWLK